MSTLKCRWNLIKISSLQTKHFSFEFISEFVSELKAHVRPTETIPWTTNYQGIVTSVHSIAGHFRTQQSDHDWIVMCIVLHPTISIGGRFLVAIK